MAFYSHTMYAQPVEIYYEVPPPPVVETAVAKDIVDLNLNAESTSDIKLDGDPYTNYKIGGEQVAESIKLDGEITMEVTLNKKPVTDLKVGE